MQRTVIRAVVAGASVAATMVVLGVGRGDGLPDRPPVEASPIGQSGSQALLPS